MSQYTEVPVVAYELQSDSEVSKSWLTPGSVGIDVMDVMAPDRLRVSIGTGSYHIRSNEADSREASIDWDERFRLGALEAERVRLEVLTQGSCTLPGGITRETKTCERGVCVFELEVRGQACAFGVEVLRQDGEGMRGCSVHSWSDGSLALDSACKNFLEPEVSSF